jgi:hypothetical protein
MPSNHKEKLLSAALLHNIAPLSLLTLTLFTVFIIPLMPLDAHGLLLNFSYSAIFFISVIALRSKRRIVLTAALLAFFTAWLATIMGAPVVLLVSRISNFIFFNIVVVLLITQIARSKTVNLTVITEAVTGYLLLGLMFSFFVAILAKVQPGAFSFIGVDKAGYTDVIYFTFVTLTTLGYGDLLPVSPIAKSLALLIAVTGQLYIAIIIAMLVGKFLNPRDAEQQAHQ